MAKSKLPRALGWMSIGLGLTELTGAERLAEALGVPQGRGLIRAFGARELLKGFGLLGQRRKRPWLWARVAGDVLDLASLGAGMRQSGARRGRLMAAMGVVAGATLVDLYAAARA